jgi:hypothetical protein
VIKENVYPWTCRFEVHLEGRLFNITMNENIKNETYMGLLSMGSLTFWNRKERTLKKVLEL